MAISSSIRLDQALVDSAASVAKAMSRTVPKQIEHWAKIGKAMEDNPDLPVEFVRDSLIALAEMDAGEAKVSSFGQ